MGARGGGGGRPQEDTPPPTPPPPPPPFPTSHDRCVHETYNRILECV